MSNPFVFDVIVTCKENPFLEKCIRSIKDQTYPHFRIHLIVDPSDDIPYSEHFKNSSRMHVTRNKQPLGVLHNLVDAIYNPVIPNDAIIVRVDGDDALANNMVLERLADIYNRKSPLMTYGGRNLGGRFVTPEITITDSRTYRSGNTWVYHLCTFRKWLFLKVNIEDLKNIHGQFFTSCSDGAHFFPMVELAGVENLYHIDFPAYSYNYNNPESFFQIYEKNIEQKLNSSYIRKLPPYEQM